MASQESGYLTELMAAFPAAQLTSHLLADAEAMIQLRYQSLLDNWVDSREMLSRLDSTSEGYFSSFFEELGKLSHRTLYGGVLSNAGSYRQAAEPNGGTVYFGPYSRGHSEFTGTPADKIEGELSQVFRHLVKNASDPVSAATIFYQQFVRVHPFYDANGRICRLLVSVYLDYHRRYVDWDTLHSQGDWIHKLNACHKRQGQHLYNTYLGRLIDYFAGHVRSKSEFELELDE